MAPKKYGIIDQSKNPPETIDWHGHALSPEEAVEFYVVVCFSLSL